MEDNIKNLYEALKSDYDLGSEQDFRKSLSNAASRRNLYNAIKDDYEVGSEVDFYNSLGYGDDKGVNDNSVDNVPSGAMSEGEYGKLSPTGKDAARGVGVAPERDAMGLTAAQREDILRNVQGIQQRTSAKTEAEIARRNAGDDRESRLSREGRERNGDVINRVSTQRPKETLGKPWGEPYDVATAEEMMKHPIQQKPKEPTAEEKAEHAAAMIDNAEMELDAPDYFIIDPRQDKNDPTNRMEITTKNYTDKLVGEEYAKAEKRKRDYLSKDTASTTLDLGVAGGFQSVESARAKEASKYDDPEAIEKAVVARVEKDKNFIMNSARRSALEMLWNSDKYKDTDDSALYSIADNFAKQAYERALADAIAKTRRTAVEREKPKDNWMGAVESVVDGNSMATGALGTVMTPGHVKAREKAMAEYGQEHPYLSTAGAIAGMAADPAMRLGAGVGAAAGKGYTALALRSMPEVEKTIGARALMMSPKYVMGQRAVQGAANFATFEVGSEAARQASKGEYSGMELAAKGIHGAVLGGVMSLAGNYIGNATDRAVKNAGSKTEAVAKRVAGTGVGIGTEIAIFATPDAVERISQGESGDKAILGSLKDAATMVLGFKAQHAVKGAAGLAGMAIKSRIKPKDRSEELRKKGFWSSVVDRLTAVSETSFTEEEKDELRSHGYGDLADMSHKEFAASAMEYDERKPKAALGHDASVKEKGATVSEPQKVEQYFDRVSAMMQDESVSETARAKMAYVITGRKVPMSAVMGSNSGKTEDGKYWVDALSARGVISHKVYDNEAAARRAQAEVDRQAELNTIDLGERYKEAETDNRQLSEAVRQAAAEYATTPEEIMRRYQEGEDKEITKRVKELYDKQEKAYVLQRPEGIRAAIGKETGVDVDKAIRKDASKRTDEEQAAVEEYARRLYPEQRGSRENRESRETVGIEENRGFNDNNGINDPNVPADPTIHKDGLVHRARLYPQNGGEAQEVYIIDGNVVLAADGTVDESASDEMIIYRDASGEAHTCTPREIMELMQPEEPSGVDRVSRDGRESRDFNDLKGSNDVAATAPQFEANQEVRLDVGGEAVDGVVAGVSDDGKTVVVDYEDAGGNVRREAFLIATGEGNRGSRLRENGEIKDDNDNKGIKDFKDNNEVEAAPTEPTQPVATATPAGGENLTTESADYTEKGETSEVQPIGRGVFGNIYDQFKGKIKAAADFLIKKRGGMAQGVLHRTETGDIGLAWGNKKGGLEHIIEKHIIEYSDFDSVDEAIDKIKDVAENGSLTWQDIGEKARIEKDGYVVVASKSENGQFVLTAFDASRKMESKKRSDADATRLRQSILNVENGTPVSQSTTSESKDTQTSDTAQGNGENLSAVGRIPVDAEGNALYESAPQKDTWEALVEMNEGDEAEAIDTARTMAENAREELAREEKKQPKKGKTVAEIQANKKAHRDALAQLQAKAAYWDGVAGYKEAELKRQKEQARREKAARLAEARAVQAKKGRYSEENAELGDYMDFRDYVMRTIATGGLRLRWSDDPDTPTNRGLASHLGMKGSNAERNKRIWMLSNEGLTPQAAAESLVEGYSAAIGNMGYAEDVVNTQDALDELLDVVSSYDSPRSMMDAVKGRHTQLSEDDIAEEERAREYQLADEAAAMGMDVEEWRSYKEATARDLQEWMDTVSDEELYGIMADADKAERELQERAEAEMAAEVFNQEQRQITNDNGKGNERSETGDGVLPSAQADNERAAVESPAARQGRDAGLDGVGGGDVQTERKQAEASSNDGRGSVGQLAERQGGVSQREEITAPLSENEVDEYDKPFVLSQDGSTVFGTVDADSGLTEAPIKLSVGENHVDDNGNNHGYGLLHIEAEHGEQIKAAGYNSIEEFVEEVAKNYTDIREGSKIADHQTYLLEVSDEHNNTLFIQLSNDGKYWNVNSAGIFRKRYSRRKPKVFTVPAVGESTNTDTSEVDSSHNEGATAPAGNSPNTSDGKVMESSATEQGNEGKSVDDVLQAIDERLADWSSREGAFRDVMTYFDILPFETQKAFLEAHGIALTKDAFRDWCANRQGKVRKGVREREKQAKQEFDEWRAEITTQKVLAAAHEANARMEEAMKQAEQEVNTNPTEAQKETGNSEQPKPQEGESPIDYAKRVSDWKEEQDKANSKAESDSASEQGNGMKYSDILTIAEEEAIENKAASDFTENVNRAMKRGGIPNPSKIHGLIGQLGKKIKAIENGMATGVSSDAEFIEAQKTIAKLRGQQRAARTVLQDFNKRLKDAEERDSSDDRDFKDNKDFKEEGEQRKEKAQTEDKRKKKNKLGVSEEEKDEALKKLRDMLLGKGGNITAGLDMTTLLEQGGTLARYYVGNGLEKFADFAKTMYEDMAKLSKDAAEQLKPYIKRIYMDLQGDMDISDDIISRMDDNKTVRSFNMETLGRKETPSPIDTAREIAKELEVDKNANRANEVKGNKDIKGINEEKAAKPNKGTKKAVSSQEKADEPSLFDDVEPQNDNSNGKEEVHLRTRPSTTEREGGHEPRQNEPLGESQQHEVERADERGMGGRDSENSVSDKERGTRVPITPHGEKRLNAPKNTHNNHAERGTDYAPRGESARIEANIKAIETMQRLIESGEKATPEDMAVLRRFSGWGGLGAAFRERTAFGQGSPYNDKLKSLLTPEQYAAANMSRNSAYYTPAEVIDTLWDVAKAMGFKGGNVLEGSAGIGNILGLMPTDMSERSDIHAVEIDNVTGQILSLLYPDAKVDVQGFEKTQIPNNSVDLAITNVLFVTGLHVFDETGDKDLSKKFTNIHDFCIAKNVRKLREGGIGIFISSSGTLDNSTKLRQWLTGEGNADVVGAFRMNNKTFGGTGATSDIIVVRKRVNGKKSANAIDVSGTSVVRTVEYDTGETKRGSDMRIIKKMPLDINQYFAEHPENMAGEMKFAFENGDTFRATSKALYPTAGKNQSQMLADWAKQFATMDWEKAEERTEGNDSQVYYEDLGKDVKEGSMLVGKDGKLKIAHEGKASPVIIGSGKNRHELNDSKVKGHTKAECFNSYKAIKDALAEVLEYQVNNEDDKGLKPLLAKLNKAYDDFVSTYGHLNKNTSISFLRQDIDFSSIAALEEVKASEDAATHKRTVNYDKTDIFSHRVVEKETEPKPTNVKDGIIASLYLNGRIDVPYIAQQLGKSENEVRKEILDSGLGFENPITTEMDVSYEYLSGNVREKLQQARDNNADGRYNSNIRELEKVIPNDIPAHLIEFTLGSSWVEPKLFEDFVMAKTGVECTLHNIGGTWIMNGIREWEARRSEQNRALGVISEICDKTILGHELIEAALKNKTINVSKTQKTWDGKTETIRDQQATIACANKIDELRQDFKDWAREKMQSDTEMAERMERVYNETFNNYVPKTIPDEFIPKHFGGAATVIGGKEFSLRTHQAKAVILGTTQPTMLAHEVGTGKTYTLITTAMEMRRLGTARKPMIIVQNATVGQFVGDAKELYPNAKILTLEDADRNKEGRKNFYAKIRYNDWDMVVVPQSVFERIPDSPEREARFVEDKIEEKLHVLEEMRKSVDDNDTLIKQAEKEIESLEDELNDIRLGIKSEANKNGKDKKQEAKTVENVTVRAKEMLDRETDDTLNFDDMGIDAILVDEAHEYKHLGFATAMQRGVKGIDSSYSKKSQGVYLKTQAVLENNNGKNVVFATGTPISNTAAEIWTFMRYLMPADTMKAYGIYYFDDFVRNFGLIQQTMEFNASGKYKETNRFLGYINLPELVRIWSSVADTVRTADAGEVSDKIPEMEGGKAQDVFLPQTKTLRSVMKFVKAELDRFDAMTPREKKQNRDLPLRMYGIAKAAAVDARLVLADAPDEASSKTNETVRQTLRSLEETKDYNGVVAIFADNYQNKHSGFNLYEDIRKKLIDAGVPSEQVVVMKSEMGVSKKLEIFDRVNRGEVRVVMGSTFTLGTGVNIQERLHTLIHVDAPVRPMDYTQRNGRILRQGNMHKEWNIPVRVLRFGVEDSLDVTAYERLKIKGAIADSIMSGKKLLENNMENRVLEEEQDVFSDITAQLSGSQYALLKNQMEKEVKKLESRKKQWESQQIYVHNQRPKLQGFIKSAEERKAQAEKALKKVEAVKDKAITVGGQTYRSVDEMGDYIKEFNKKQREIQDKVRGDYHYDAKQSRTLTVNVGGIDFTVKSEISKEQRQEKGQLSLSFFASTQMTYDCPELGLKDVPVKGMQIRAALEDITQNVMSGNDFRERIEDADASIERNKRELATLNAQDGKPFADAEKLEKAKAKLAEYDEAMKKELAEKEAKYAEMDSEVKEADGVTEATEEEEEDAGNDDVRYRTSEDDAPLEYREVNTFKDGETLDVDVHGNVGEWEYSVRGLNATFDTPERLLDAFRNKYPQYVATLTNGKTEIVVEPWSKFLKGGKGDAAFRAREIRRAQQVVADMADKLHLKEVKVISDINEVKDLKGRLAAAKGWYDTKTGKIVIVLPNHTDTSDVMRTILHEGVAHYGLRKLFGEHFDTFLDNVYNNVDGKIREAIDAKAAKMRKAPSRPPHGGGHTSKRDEDYRREATEEYMADLAEDTNFENAMRQGWWAKIKSFFLDMLAKVGIKLKNRLTDNELRYVLWRSYRNLVDPSEYRSPIETARDVAMQDKLGVGNYRKIHEDISRKVAEIPRTVGDFLEKGNIWDFDSPESVVYSYLKGANGDLERAKNDARKWYENTLRLLKEIPDSKNLKTSAKQTKAALEILDGLRDESGIAAKEPTAEYGKQTAEERAIVEKAKANGTYMKAPNGKPTKLNETQWAQVRTKAFKDWFGDWEKTARIVKLLRSEPVKVSFNGEYPLNRADAKQWLKDNIRGSYTNADTNEKIEVSRVGINEVTSHGSQDEAHMKSLVAIPQMIHDAIFVDEIPNEKGNDKYDSYRYYVCGLKIDGEDYTAKMVVGVKDDSKYYDHRLTQIEKGKLIDNLNGLSNSVAENQNASISVGKDTKLHSILQTNSSKVVDENGEPLVVQHGTPVKNLTRFDISHVGDNTGDEGVYGSGFYFAPIDEDNADFSMYGDNILHAYLNIRNPKEFTTTIGVGAKGKFGMDLLSQFDTPEVRKLPFGLIINGKQDIRCSIGELIDNTRQAFADYKSGKFDGLIEALRPIWGDDGAVSQVITRKGGIAYPLKVSSFINDYVGGKALAEALKKDGYDGVLAKAGKDIAPHELVAFAPNQIKSATDNNGEFSTEDDDIRFRFIGEKGAERLDKAEEAHTRLDNLNVARDMENAKKDALTIKIATGWERGADGKWRYEQEDIETLPDIVEKLTVQDKDYILKDLLTQDTYDKLVSAYPDFKNTIVHSIDFGEEYGSASYSYGEIAFNINAVNRKDRDWIERTMAHEIQHGIQSIEGFEKGDSPTDAKERYASAQKDIETAGYGTLKTAADIRKKAERLIKSGKHKRMRMAVREAIGSKARRDGYEPFGVVETLATYHNYNELHNAAEKVGAQAIDQEDYGKMNEYASMPDVLAEREYMRNGGEVEARNVERRMNMTDEQRRQSLASETEDVAREDQIFLRAALGGKRTSKSASYGIDGELRMEKDDIRFRDDTDPLESVNVRDEYEKTISESMYQVQEALQDSMLGLKTLMQDVWKASGEKGKIEDIPTNENAYLAENRMSSATYAQQEKYAKDYRKPLVEAIGDLVKEGAKREQVVDYMMAKHGLERNKVMAQRDFDAYQKEHPTGTKTIDDFRKKDYSGLTKLTGESDTAAAEVAAEQMVNNFESGHDTTELWKRTNAATKATLQTMYESGILSKKKYEEIRDMYDNYIPLRGFAEETTDEVYGYLQNRDEVGRANIMKRAFGRTTKADDPIANIMAMAEAGIAQANRNRMKLTFLNFALNHPSDVVSVSRLWLKKNDVTGEWEPLFADVKPDDDAATVEQKVSAFEQKMAQLKKQEPDKYKHGRDAVNIPYILKKDNMREHQVLVKRGGETYVITINGNPRAAQALNGLSNPSGAESKLAQLTLGLANAALRNIAAFYTTRNPNFVSSNFVRDMEYANTMVWAKESPQYARRFNYNCTVNTNPKKMWTLFEKYESNKLDMSNEIEHAFYDFMVNGGETGYTIQRDLDKQKKIIARELKDSNGKLSLPKAWRALAEKMDRANRSAENSARFAAFLTSRQMGRDVGRSVWDAKEISVNFNKKGAGGTYFLAKGQTAAGNAAAVVSAAGRSMQVFWNAGVQGLANNAKVIGRNPKKALPLNAALFALGATIAAMAAGGGDGDDDESKYFNIPANKRRDNLCFVVGDHIITIPLSVEHRAIYGLGELAMSFVSGKEPMTNAELAAAIGGQLSQLMPIDFMEGGGGTQTLIPSQIKPLSENESNTDWTGLPIYKNTPYNENSPEWTKAYKRTSRLYVEVSKALNKATGGNDVDKGWIDDAYIGIHGWFGVKLNNPAQIEHLVSGYFGQLPNQLISLGEMAAGVKEPNIGSVPVVSRLWQKTDERTKGRNLNEQYYHAANEAKDTADTMSRYRKKARLGSMEFAERLSELMQSDEYKRYRAVKGYQKTITALQSELDNIEDKTDAEAVDKCIKTLKKKMLEALDKEKKAGYPTRDEDYNYMDAKLEYSLEDVTDAMKDLKREREDNDDGENSYGVKAAKEDLMREVKNFNKKH